MNRRMDRDNSKNDSDRAFAEALAALPSLHDSMAAWGAEGLRDALLASGQVPVRWQSADALLDVCRQAQAEWLKGEIVSPLYADLLPIVLERLRDTSPDE